MITSLTRGSLAIGGKGYYVFVYDLSFLYLEIVYKIILYEQIIWIKLVSVQRFSHVHFFLRTDGLTD